MNPLPRRLSHRLVCHAVSAVKRQPPLRGRAAAEANRGQDYIYPPHIRKRPSSPAIRKLGRATMANTVIKPTHEFPPLKPISEEPSAGVPEKPTEQALTPIEFLNLLKALNQPWAWLMGIFILISLFITAYKLLIENSENPFHTVESEMVLNQR